MYGSGISLLGDLVGELDGNSEKTFTEVHSHVSGHFSALEDVSAFRKYILLPLRVTFVYDTLCCSAVVQKDCFRGRPVA